MTIQSGLEAGIQAPDADAHELLEPEIERAPRDKIEAGQEAAVLDLVRYAWDNSALYRELWTAAGVTPDDITSIEDFTTMIPTLTKADIIG